MNAGSSRARPVLFLIDDDLGVMQALRDDLIRRFGEDFRVMAESSAAAALTVLRRLSAEHQQVALLIADHDMSEMPGTEFLARAHEMHPRLPAAVQLERGYILTGRDVVPDRSDPSWWPQGRVPLPLETSVPGVFAIGDVRYRAIKRVASAVGDGATAVRLTQEYLSAEDPAASP